MEGVFWKLLNMSITAGWLVIAVVIYRSIFKRAPKWINCMLWAFVAVRLLCPIMPESVISVLPQPEVQEAKVYEILYVPMAQEKVQEEATTIQNKVPEQIEVTKNNTAEYTDTIVNNNQNQYQTEVKNRSLKERLINYADIIWCGGMIVMLLYALWSYLQVYRTVSASVYIEKRVCICDYIITPFILGIFRPVIYLPSSLDEKTAVSVLAHERAHLKRMDYLWKPFGFVLLAVYWFNPIIWIAYILLCRDIELACDEKVIKDMDQETKKEYMEALLSSSVSRVKIAACPLAFGETGLKERMKFMTRYRKPALWIMITAMFTCILVGACFLTTPKAEETQIPFGQEYCVSEVVYLGGFDTRNPEEQPLYRLTEDYELLMLKDKNTDEWESYGAFSEVELQERRFDDYLWDTYSGFWTSELFNKDDMKELRENCKQAWRITGDDDIKPYFYYLLQQENGDHYLVYGNWDAAAERAQDQMENVKTANNSKIEAIYKLKKSELTVYGLADMDEAEHYVSARCLYIHPQERFDRETDDSRLIYSLTDKEFILSSRNGDCYIKTEIKGDWQEFPYTEDEWNSMFQLGEMAYSEACVDISNYENIQYRPLSETYSLLKLDDKLLMVEIQPCGKLGNLVWSVWEVMPKETMGSVVWTYEPDKKMSGFAFELEFYGTLNAWSSAGEIFWLGNEAGEVNQGREIVVQENMKEKSEWSLSGINAPCTLYWRPLYTEILYAELILTTVENGEVCYYRIYINGEPQTDGSIVYTAEVGGKICNLVQDKSGVGILTLQRED